MKRKFILIGMLPFMATLQAQQGGISIYDENPSYWQYNGEATLLVGGSSDDNLFQSEDVEEELALLHSLGGNYVRCTMSSRDEGDEKPYLKNAEGLYDLEKPNPRYWDRFEKFLSVAEEFDIVAQVELWATYDFYWNTWSENPFNPKLNTNYDSNSSRLPDEIDHPAQSENNPFFLTIPELEDNPYVLRYQKAFVDKICEIAFAHGNVLYTIDNETNVPYQWGRYWSKYIRDAAEKAGKMIYVTEMWDSWDPSDGEVQGAIVQHPELNEWFEEFLNPKMHEHSGVRFTIGDSESYQFVDVANNNAQSGEVHYRTALWVRESVLSSEKVRPINNVKIYGGYKDKIWSGTIKDGRERFWRNVFAGHASVRFHRQPSGIGLNDIAQKEITRMRKVTDSVDLFSMEPRNDLLKRRSENEAYCLASTDGSEIILYFPEQGNVRVKAKKARYSKKVFFYDGKVTQEEVALPGSISNSSNESIAIVLKRID